MRTAVDQNAVSGPERGRRRRSRPGGAAALALCATGLVLAPGTPVSAASVRATPDASIRAAHFSPTTPGVDVYLARFAGNRAPTKLWLSRVSYGAVSGYQALTPGVYTVAMRPAGASARSRPVLTWTLNARPGAAYTVAGVGAGAAVRGVVVKDDLATPPGGHGRVRVIQAASRAPVVTVTASNGSVIAPGTRFATVSGYVTLPAGRWTVRASSAASPAESAAGPVAVRSGQITSILLLDAKGAGITLRTVLDSSSSGAVPRAAVDAGGGATARVRTAARPMGEQWLGLPAVALIVVLAAAGPVALQRRRRTDAGGR